MNNEPITQAKLTEWKAACNAANDWHIGDPSCALDELLYIAREAMPRLIERVEELEALERAAIELVRSTAALSAEVREAEGPIQRGSETDWACCRHDWANREFWSLARESATAEKGKP